MRSPLSALTLLSAVVAIGLIAAPGHLAAREATRSRAADTTASARAAPTLPSDAELGAKAQRETEARQRAWDRKMKAVAGSICTGC